MIYFTLLLNLLLLLLSQSLAMANTFNYFAYGSNLLSNRIHVNNPTAVRIGIGKLENYRLDFITYVKYWKGTVGTIVEAPGESVWGAIWKISMDDLPRLDRQEGVSSGMYTPLTVDVVLPDGTRKTCRTYKQTAELKELVELSNLPKERRPSWIYLKTIIKGAAESGLPKDYQDRLKNVAHNGYSNEEHIGFKL